MCPTMCKAYTELCARLVVRSTFRPLAIDAAKAGLMPLVWEPRPRGLGAYGVKVRIISDPAGCVFVGLCGVGEGGGGSRIQTNR